MKIQLKRSNQLEADGSAKKPTASQMEYGELAVNYNTDDPAIFLENDTGQIVRIAGKGAEGGTQNLQEVTDEGNSTTNGITVGNGTITLGETGNALFANGVVNIRDSGDISMGNPFDTPGNGIVLLKSGRFVIKADNEENAFKIVDGDNITTKITNLGEALFETSVTSAEFIGDGSKLTNLPGGLPDFRDLPALA